MKDTKYRDPGAPYIMIWVPKSAGSSLFAEIATVDPSLQGFYNIPLAIYKKYTMKNGVTFGHSSLEALTKEGIITEEFVAQTFKFCFVRNPWDRLVSLYFYSGLNKTILFEDLCHLLHQYWDTIIPPLGWYNVAKFRHPDLQHIDGNQLHPMCAWIPDDVQFIGRFENLEQDREELFSRLRLPVPERQWKLKSENKPFQEYYSKETKDLVAGLYKTDIERFNYSFDGN
jgi:hypothetical protein